MTDPDEKPPETLQEYFVEQLRRFRRDRGLSQAQLAERMNYSPGLISMVETLQRTPTADFTAACDTALDTDGALSNLLPMLAREAYPKWFQSFVTLEAEAVVINEFEVQVVPGLLQTPAYARAVLEAAWPPVSEEETERRVSARLSRQAVFARSDAPLLSFVLDESVLRRPVGGPTVMAEQLQRLCEAAALPCVRLNVLSFARSAHAPLDGSFTVLETADGERLAYLESTGGGSIVPDANSVKALTHTFEAARGEAMDSAASVRFISRLAEELYGDGRAVDAALAEE